MFLSDADLLGREYLPGNELEIEVGMTVGGALSQQTAVATIDYMSGGRPGIAQLRVQATVPADYQLSAKEFDLGTLTELDSRREYSVQLNDAATANAPVRMTEVSCSDTRVSCELDDSKQTCTIVFESGAKARREKINVPVVFTTTSAMKIHSMVYLRGDIQPGIEIKPRSVLIRSNYEQSDFTTSLKIHTNRPATVEVDSDFAPDIKSLHVAAKRIDEMAWDVTLAVKTNEVRDAFALPIHVRFADGAEVIKSVPVVHFLGDQK